jgi:hypothetical protein
MRWQVYQALNKFSVSHARELARGRKVIGVVVLGSAVFAMMSVFFTPGWFVMFLSVAVL